MATPVSMPALGESVTEGTVTRWLKQPGDAVAVDEPLLEVSTDKVDTEIPSPAGGVLLEIKVSEDETVDVGTELAVIGDAAEADGSGDGAAPSPTGDASDAAAPVAEAPAAGDPASQAEPELQAQSQPAPASAASGADGSSGSSGGSGASGTAVTMPALGESVTEGTVTRWLKQPGDSVDTDEPLLEVSTDKVDTEIPSPAAGVLLEIKVGEDETVDVGTELAVIGDASAAAGGSTSPEPESAPASQSAPAGAPTSGTATDEQQEAQRQEEQPAAEAAGGGGLGAEVAQHAEAEAQSEQKTTSRSSADAPQRQEAGSGDDARPAAAPAAPPAASPKSSSAATRGDDDDAYVTPLVRRLAAERGVDLSAVEGTGVGGRIRKQDVLGAAEAAAAPADAPAAAPTAPADAGPTQGSPAAAPSAEPDSSVRGSTVKMSRLRKVIAQRMVESLQVSAQLTTVVEVDVTAIARLRARAKPEFEAREGTRLSFLPFFAKATLEALKQHPSLNATIDTDAGEITYLDAEHLGVAVDTERGLLVPVIRDAGDLNIAGLARRIADIAQRTRTNRITPDELSGGSFTLTNTGSRGALFDTPIINQPQVGILGTGAVVKRPVVVTDSGGADAIAIRQMVYFALTYDHRLVDGADAARFLTTVKQRLEQGAFEADLAL